MTVRIDMADKLMQLFESTSDTDPMKERYQFMAVACAKGLYSQGHTPYQNPRELLVKELLSLKLQDYIKDVEAGIYDDDLPQQQQG